MAKTPKQQYQDDNYDRVAIRVKKGLRDEYQRAAAEFGISFRELVQRGVEMFIAERSGGEVNFPAQTTPITTQPQPKIPAQDKQLLDAASSLSTESKKALLKFLQSLNVAAENKAENTAKNASVDNHEPI